MDTDGELVKYMSSLPNYLERGVNIHEKAFNIGVLDWGNLERWQHRQKIKLRRPRGPSTSRGELSSSSLTDSTHHGHAKVNENICGLRSHTASCKDLHDVKSLDHNRHHNIQGIHRALEKHGQGDVDVSRRNCLDDRTSDKIEGLASQRNGGLAYSPDAKIKLQGSGNGKRINKLEQSSHCVEKELTRRPNGVVVPSAGGVQSDLSERSASSTNISRAGLEDATPGSFLEKHMDAGPSTCISGKHVAEAAPASMFSETTTSKDMRRCQSSPRRKLLHPISKAEGNFLLQHIEPLPQSSVSVDVDSVCKPLNSPRIWSSRLKCCRSVDVSNSQLGKSVMSAGQALLRVAFKNGLPLFTFALNGESDILAASTKKLGGASRKSGSKWSYTLFKIPAVKRAKASKMKGGKIGPHRGYPMMLSQLTVSEFHHSKSSRQREFVLSHGGLKNVELAAIVVQIPSIVGPNTVLHGYDSETLQVGPKGPSLDVRSHLEDGENNQLLSRNESFISATVILPSGVHSLPSKGEPSSLIERWKSGGSCDCGGWDLDCELRVLRSSKACSSSSVDKLAVFTKVGEEEDQAVLSLSTSKDGTYHIEFNSSISELQAFSICIAVLDCGSISQQ